MTDKISSFDRQLAEILRSQRENLRAIARRSGDQDVDDVVHDAVVKVVEIARREEIRTPENYLYRSIRRMTIDRFRRRATRAEVIVSETGVEPSDPSADPERAYLASERLALVVATINGMPSRRREAFLMSRMHGLSYVEIARRQNVSVKTVEKHLHLALLDLLALDEN